MGFNFQHRQKFLFSKMSRLALGSTQPLIQWAPAVPSPGCSGQGVKLTTHLHPVPRLRMSGAIHLLHLYSTVYLFLHLYKSGCVCSYKGNDESVNSNSEPINETLATDTNTTKQLLISTFKRAL